LNVLTRENDALASHIAAARTALDADDRETAVTEIRELRQIGNHYRKKGDLLYPLLANRYEVTGPSNVMWTVDGEIRDELRDLAARPDVRDWDDRARAVLKRADEMIYKEANILFPICAANFTDEEWGNLAFDISEYAPCLIEPTPVWSKAAPMSPAAAPTTAPTAAPTAAPAAAPAAGSAPAKTDGAAATGSAPAEIVLPSGTFTLPELRALLNTIPGEITFVGADDLNRYFNESKSPKDFARPLTALGRPVYSCHPPKVESMVRWLFEEFRTGKQDSFDMWHKRDDRDLWVRYMAVRDREGTYLGTLEFVQDMTAARRHFEEEKGEPFNPMAGIEEREEQEW
ncbi:MAG: PAS domain-containing protein, partial [Olegusella sp.]|nr:PAS domain-containing protein [Olegusella sp.]